MATWLEVKQFLHQNYTLDSDQGEMVTITFGGVGRSQVVFVSQVGDFLRIGSPIAQKGQVAPGAVLAAAGIFGVGDIGTFYVLMHAQLLKTLDAEEILEVLPIFAATADEIEQELTKGGDTF